MKKFVMGLDFGTLSVRAVIVDAYSGKIHGEASAAYMHGVMTDTLPDGTKLPAHSALQHPEDYISCTKKVISQSLDAAGLCACDIAGVGIDFTACTVLPIDREACPMCMHDEYKSDANAYVKLWKSHSADAQAKHIAAVARQRGERFLDCYGGDVSSEWLLPKILQTLNTSPKLYENTYKFVEAGDWIVRLLTGSFALSASCAGFKGFFTGEDGYPSNEFFKAVDERFDGIVGDKINSDVSDVCCAAGYVSREGAQLFGLCEGTAVAPAIIDAHAGAPAIGISGEGQLMMILGTSGCHIVSTSKKAFIKGSACAYGAVFDGLYSYEQGQCCFGDCFDWLVSNFVPEAYQIEARERGIGIHKLLSERAAALEVGESGLLALDWFNGNRSVLADSRLSGMILGLTLGTRAEHVYRALIEALAFSTKMIIENYEQNGIAIESICASGGIALKDELLMQIFSDVLGREIKVSSASQACALGSAIYASLASGIHKDMASAVKYMSAPVARIYAPIAENNAAYEPLYSEYVRLHDYFGRGGNDVMKRLLKK